MTDTVFQTVAVKLIILSSFLLSHPPTLLKCLVFILMLISRKWTFFRCRWLCLILSHQTFWIFYIMINPIIFKIWLELTFKISGTISIRLSPFYKQFWACNRKRVEDLDLGKLGKLWSIDWLQTCLKSYLLTTFSMK